MCGIVGLVDRRAQLGETALTHTVRMMNNTLLHRGPDGGEVWVAPESGVGFGHRRLAIVDLSPTGVQPMASGDGRFVVTYNGEIFNYLELRAELLAMGVKFRGESDTEVLLEGFVRWGIAETIAKAVGMFAIALWDKREKSLWLIRDRLGVKPLYYAHYGQRLIFGSELKALCAVSDWQPGLDRDALTGFMRHGYVAGPRTIYKEARKLMPGQMLEWHDGQEPKLSIYWDARAKAIEGRAQWDKHIDPREAVDRLDALLREAIRQRMIADVPLGAFLSGGIDSSTVVALMQQQSSRPVRSFSIGFAEDGYDEAGHARAVAKHLGTDHTELYVEPSHALGVVPKLAEWYDEPFADSSQIPTYLVSEMTRKHVTVALSGDGGDENFAGYSRYIYAGTIWKQTSRLPGPLRALGAAMLRNAGAPLLAAASFLLPGRVRAVRPAEKAAKLAQVLRLDSIDNVYRHLISQWHEPEAIVAGGTEPRGPLWDETLARDMPEPVARMQLLDTMTYLPEDILTKVDRATMAVALEGREPLLDHRVVEFAWALPMDLKLKGGEGKWILREVLARYMPRSLTDRPKMGFGVPIDSWLRGPLRDWAEDLLDEKAMKADGLLDPAPIREAWNTHISGTANMHYPIWTVLMFRAWQRRWL
ncbi:MAG: asparagine synthase (glutamine-hydrolyzing) [Alphaproteobacteria bacterium]|nr:asparagine synthase (glutamine-hydrolyzing) [Alphaproteobacteria bacterium]